MPAGVPASVVASPEDRIDHDPGTSEFGLWPTAHHTRDGRRPRRRASRCTSPRPTGRSSAGAPCLGEHTDDVLRDVLGLRRRRDRRRCTRRRSYECVADADRTAGRARRRHGRRARERARARAAGKLLADLGADVIVVEPPGGHPSRALRTVRRRRAGAGAQPLLVELQHVEARRRARPRSCPTTAARSSASWPPAPTSCSRASRPGAWPTLGIDHDALRAEHPELIWVSVTAVRARHVAGATSRPPISPCSAAEARCGAAGTTTTPSRRCAAAATRRSTSAACSR